MTRHRNFIDYQSAFCEKGVCYPNCENKDNKDDSECTCQCDNQKMKIGMFSTICPDIISPGELIRLVPQMLTSQCIFKVTNNCIIIMPGIYNIAISGCACNGEGGLLSVMCNNITLKNGIVRWNPRQNNFSHTFMAEFSSCCHFKIMNISSFCLSLRQLNATIMKISIC